jgi:hypothetical protein
MGNREILFAGLDDGLKGIGKTETTLRRKAASRLNARKPLVVGNRGAGHVSYDPATEILKLLFSGEK